MGHGLGHVCTAYRNRTPMIVIVCRQIRALLPNDPYPGATDAAIFLKPYVKWSIETGARRRCVSRDSPCLSFGHLVVIRSDVHLVKDRNAESETTVAARKRIAGPLAGPDVLRALVSAVDASEGDR
jgi:benzoylformate decarboxylase